MELSESPDERFVQLDTKMSSLSEKVEGILTAENTEMPKDRYAQLDEKVSSLSQKVDEILNLLKSESVKTRIDVKSLQSENRHLKMQVKECEGTICQTKFHCICIRKPS